MAAAASQFGRYRVVRILGNGAMGVVYEALDPRLNRSVAVKTILKKQLEGGSGLDLPERFAREAQAIAKLSHPHIVQVHDYGEEGDVAFFVMELIKGQDLKSYLDAGKRFAVEEAVRITVELCAALAFAHRAGIVHRDIKPGNVMLDERLSVKLADFGVARIRAMSAEQSAEAATFVGTPAYMAPEQVSGRSVDQRADVFAAGVVLYQLLTGEMPFAGTRPWTIAKKILNDEPTAPSRLDESLSPAFDAVVAKALAKQPERRWQSAEDLANALKGALSTHQSINSGRTTPGWRTKAATGAVAVLLLAAMAGWYFSTQRTTGFSGPPMGIDAKSIAVLPFVNMSQDSEAAYFADGVHEDLLTQLALIGDMKVVSRTSVMDYRNTKKNMRQIGEELKVTALVEGSVRRVGQQVRVTAQLIDARTDRHIWAKSYDRELKDIFAIQSELATEIAKALKVSLDPREAARLGARPTQSMEAYDYFLRYHEARKAASGGTRDVGLITERIGLLSKAVALDPDFSLAWAELAAEHARAYAYIDMTPTRLAAAKEAMARGKAKPSDDLRIFIAEGVYHHYAFNDSENAAKAYEAVLAAAPFNVEALAGLANVRMRQLRWTDRAMLLERALSVDPRNADALAMLAAQCMDFRQYARATALMRQLMSVRPSDYDLKAKYYWYEYLRSGSWDEYHKWRSTLSPDASGKFIFISFLDLQRAVSRRDFEHALRLADVDADDAKSVRISPINHARKLMIRMGVLHAKADVAQARRTAAAALRFVEAEFERTTYYYAIKAAAYAMLGEERLAFEALRKAIRRAEEEAGPHWASLHRRASANLYALLGQRQKALAELSRQLRLPASNVNEMRIDLTLVSLWDDPGFRALVDDPANNAPLSFDAQYVSYEVR